MAKRTTLNDIAQAVGVTPSTVQRALNNMAGVSDEKRQEIKQVALQMGYRSNVIAKMLQKQGISIAAVLPEPTYYAQRLWDGVDHFLSENAGFNITCHRYTYPRSPENLASALEAAWCEHGKTIDGIITMGELDENVRAVYHKWNENKVPLIWVGTDGNKEDRLCCSRGIGEMAGKIAADLLMFNSQPGKPMKILLTGDFSISDQFADMQGFERVLMQGDCVYEIIKLSGKTDDKQMQELLYNRLLSEQNISAIFSTSARNTIIMCQAVEQAGLENQVKLIGSDLFPQSRELLAQGKLNAVIDKRPGWQAYCAAQALINYIMHEGQPEDTIFCCPTIVTRSNMDYVDNL